MSQNRPEQSTPYALHVIATLLTIVFGVGVFHFWLPSHIDEKASVVLIKEQLDKDQAETKVAGVPQTLLDYIDEVRSDDNSVSDAMNEDDLLQTFKQFDEDYSDKAKEIIAKRFKLPTDKDVIGGEDEFVIPDEIRDRVQFWVHIFGRYTLDHTVFYNKKNVGMVYSVLDFSDIGLTKGQGGASLKAQMIREEKARIRKMIQKVAALVKEDKIKLSGLSPEERRLAEMLLKNNDHVDVSANALLQNLATRKGFSHRIRKAYQVSGKYMPEMKRIFRERGLPEALTYLPFIESAFNLRAYSHAGAAGIWQFIEATGKRYLRIDEYVDERYDPILGAYAAATHLFNEYKFLGTWPMTVNAYNTGPGRMIQAKKQLGTTNIAKIIKHFRGSGYGSDSSNYYPEFLAVKHVLENPDQFLGDIPSVELEKFEYLALPGDMNIHDLAEESGLSIKTITEMNLAFKPSVLAGQKNLPKGYLIKIPPESKEDVLVAMQDLYREVRYATHHIVKRGESLKKISKLYDVSVQELASLNRLLPKQNVSSGDVIQLPSRENSELTKLTPTPEELVRPDNLNAPVF